MAKRYQPLKEFARSTKKPKLEVSINKGREAASTSKDTDNIHLRVTQQEPFQPVSVLWDDDEDDVLLHATQIAESEIAAKEAKKQDVAMDITESEITFSEFEPKIKEHSTQATNELDAISQLFDDDDDDFALLAAKVETDTNRHVHKEREVVKKPPLPSEYVSLSSDDEPGPSSRFNTISSSQVKHRYSDSGKPIPVQPVEKKSEEAIFKKPAPPSRFSTTSSSSDEEPGQSSQRETVPLSHQDPNVLARKQLAFEKQIQLLTERLEAMKQENKKLNQDLTNVKESMQTKTGEASMLRDELRHTKQKLDELKMEKLFQTEAVNAESKNKIEELSKEVKAKESELQLKNMECQVLKIRQADESRRHDTTTSNTFFEIPEEPPEFERTYIDVEAYVESQEFNYKPIPEKIESKSIRVTKDLFERGEIKRHCDIWIHNFQKELENLQRILAQIELDPEDIEDEISNQLVESVKNAFLEFKSYLDELDFGFHESVLSPLEYNVLEDTSKFTPGRLHSKTALYPRESIIQMRRYVALLAVVCEKSSQAAHILLEAKHEDKPLLQEAISGINKLGFSFNVCSHFGTLEAFAVLLRTMIFQLDPSDEEEQNNLPLLVGLFKELVFTRPSPWVLFELTFCVLDLCRRFPDAYSLMCVNSPRGTFKTDRSKTSYCFSHDSCIMQVYCGLMESAFPLYLPLSESIFQLQTKLCLNHVRFTFYTLTDPPHFVQKMLPTDDDEDDDGELMEELDRMFAEMREKANSLKANKNKTPYEMFTSEESKNQSENIDSVSGEESKNQSENIDPVSGEPPATSENIRITLTGNEPSSKSQTSLNLPKSKETYETLMDEQPTTSKKAAASLGKVDERDKNKNTTARLTEKEKTYETENEKPTTSKNVQQNLNEESSTSNKTDHSESETSSSNTQCQCFVKLCLSALSMVFLSLRQWVRMENSIETDRVATISRVAVHLFNFLFCDNYLTCLYREDEYTVQQFMYLICNWWVENAEALDFTDIHMELLDNIKTSHVIPKLFCEEEAKPENIAADLAQWCREANDDTFDPTLIDTERAIKNLRLMEEAMDIDDLMEGFDKLPYDVEFTDEI